MSKQILLTATILALLSSHPCFAELYLDDVMSPKIQEKTGVEDLTPMQKRALEIWINDTFVLKDQNDGPVKETSDLSLSINVNNGQQLRLSDSTLWEIDPADQSIAATWITPFPIKVGTSGNPSYPTLLTNLNTNVSVRARSTQTLAPPPTETVPAPATPSAPIEPATPQVPMPQTPPTRPKATTPAKPQVVTPPAGQQTPAKPATTN